MKMISAVSKSASTINSHFDKEEKLFEQGIKCLSLFFIGEVAKYRQYDADGQEILGEYGRIFEEEYIAALNERLTLFPTAYQTYLRGIDTAGHAQGLFLHRQKRARHKQRGQERL